MPDFAPPPRHRVRDDAVKARYSKQRHRAGDREHHQREGRSSHRLVVHLVQRAHLRQRQDGADRRHRFAHLTEQTLRAGALGLPAVALAKVGANGNAHQA